MVKDTHLGRSEAEDLFIDLFAEAFGPEKAQYLYVQYPFQDIYGNPRYIDFVIDSAARRVAIEIDGETYHNPRLVSHDKYADDLLKQNSLSYGGWQIFRWTYRQLRDTPEPFKDQIRTFLGEHPLFKAIEDYLPRQRGRVLELREHPTEAAREHPTEAAREHPTEAAREHLTEAAREYPIENLHPTWVEYVKLSTTHAYPDHAPPSQPLELREHQSEALRELAAMRERRETIALLYHATGTGKTVTAVSDARRMGGRTLFLAHTKELVHQAARQFRALWPDVSTGIFMESHRQNDTHVVCGSIQSVTQNLDLFAYDAFAYLIIDECHHGTAETYQQVLRWFRPAFTLGLTATPERADGDDLLAVFQNVAHKLDLQTAVEIGELVPVRCFRVKTNIDLADVRFSGFKYNARELESKVFVSSRNELIVATWLDYVRNRPTVVFCVSVRHAEEIERLLTAAGVAARAVSGGMNPVQRQTVLTAYEQGQLQVLCACDLLNEGWDSPRTEVLFMARPTMSRSLYLQQLGRGMRLAPGKEALIVFDFIDNANLFNQACSLHRAMRLGEYRPGGLALAPRSQRELDEALYTRGEKPPLLLDWPIHVQDYERIDLFNWQDQAAQMISQLEFVRRVNVQAETIEKYIRDQKIVPDLTVPIGERRLFHYFHDETVRQYAAAFGWTLITPANIKALFMDMIKTMDMSYSYKPVFLLALLQHLDDKGGADLDVVTHSFAAFYEQRKARGLVAEKANSLMQKGGYSLRDVQKLILSYPFRRFEDMRCMKHAKQVGRIELDTTIRRQLSEEDRHWIRAWCEARIQAYYEKRLG